MNTYVPLQSPGSLHRTQAPIPLLSEREETLNSIQYLGMNPNFSNADFSYSLQQLGYSTPPLESLPITDTILGFGQDPVIQAMLPSHEILLELVDLFFDHFYHSFPCFHKATLKEQVRSQYLQTNSPLVLYAICALSARYHHDPGIRNQSDSWYEHAKLLYDISGRDPKPVLRTIQAAICLVFFSWTVGDFSAGWLHLGKAWRQAVACNLHRLDMSQQPFESLIPEWPPNALEKEECRRTLWVLFIIDKCYTVSTVWPGSINERQYKVNIPVNETLFQDLIPEIEESAINNTLFTRNLDSLISSSSTAANPLNLFHYLVVAYVIFGRLSEYLHSSYDSSDSLEDTQAAAELDSQLLRFRLSLPRAATSVIEASDDTRGLVIWLGISLNSMAIMLHYRCNDEEKAMEQFARAVGAAKNIVQIVKDTSRTSIDLLISAHLGTPLYLAACILTIQWRISGDDTVKADIDLFGHVFDRYKEVYFVLGLKFKLALDHFIENTNREQIPILRKKGLEGLLDCSKVF